MGSKGEGAAKRAASGLGAAGNIRIHVYGHIKIVSIRNLIKIIPVHHPGPTSQISNQSFECHHVLGCWSGERSTKFFGSKGEIGAIKRQIIRPCCQSPKSCGLFFIEYAACAFECLLLLDCFLSLHVQ